MTSEYQPFDSTLKALVQTFASTLLPLFMDGVTYVETLNVELLRPTMRADRVFKVLYRDEYHILHLELKSSTDPDMTTRLLTYYANIYQEYHLPIISIIIYPFRVTMAESPLRITSRQEELLTLHFKVLPLWQLDAEQYVRNHALSIYPLLPTMQGVTNDLLLQAMQEMVEYYKEDDALIARQFVWMSIMLRRAETIAPQQKQRIQERLRMFERLWDEDPEIQRIKAEAEAKGEAIGEAIGEAKGKAEGEAIGEARGKAEGEAIGEARGKAISEARAIVVSQELVVLVVGSRFPTLTPLVREKVGNIRQIEQLSILARQIATAPDEATARWAIGTFAA